MFNYTHIVKDKEGFEWGAFPNVNIATMMKDYLSSKFTEAKFFIEEIK
jgi:hypothetical protein